MFKMLVDYPTFWGRGYHQFLVLGYPAPLVPCFWGREYHQFLVLGYPAPLVPCFWGRVPPVPGSWLPTTTGSLLLG